MDLTGPETRNGVEYALTSYRYCLEFVAGLAIDVASTWGPGGSPFVEDQTDRTTAGCHTVDADLLGPVTLLWETAGAGSLRIAGVTSTWVPADELVFTAGGATDPAALAPSGR